MSYYRYPFLVPMDILIWYHPCGYCGYLVFPTNHGLLFQHTVATCMKAHVLKEDHKLNKLSKYKKKIQQDLRYYSLVDSSYYYV